MKTQPKVYLLNNEGAKASPLQSFMIFSERNIIYVIYYCNIMVLLDTCGETTGICIFKLKLIKQSSSRIQNFTIDMLNVGLSKYLLNLRQLRLPAEI